MSYQQEITITSGITITGLVVAPEAEGVDATVVNVQAGGTLASGVVRAGGTVNGTFGATLTDLAAETGATIALETVAGASGLMLAGAQTEIAEGTLYWNGNAVHGAAAGGVLSGVSSTDPFRFQIGDGIVVSDAKLTSGTRIYALGTAEVENTTILESGNIGLSEEGVVGRNITVGGEGVAAGKATLQVRGTAYGTVISQGGQANVFRSACDTAVYSGGKVEVRGGGYASGANVYAGGSMVVSDGGTAETVRVRDGGTFTMNGDTAVVKDFTVEEGGKFSVTGGNTSGALISGATVTPFAGASANAVIAYATIHDMDVLNGATNNSLTVKRSIWSGGTVRGGENSTDRLFVDLNFYDTLYGVTFTTDATESATGICLVSAGANGGVILNDVTVKNFAYLEYAAGAASNLNILDGGYMYQRRNAVVSGVTISGVRNGVQAAATINGSDNRMTDAAVGSGGKLIVNAGAVNGATVLSGGTLSVNGAGIAVSNVTVAEGGVFSVSGTAAGKATVFGATVTPNASSTAGAAVSAWNADIHDMNVLNGRTSNYIRLESATWTGGTVRGGSATTDRLFVNLWYADTVSSVTFTTDAVQSNNLICYVSAGVNGDVELNDVTVKNFAYIEFARGSARNLTVLDGGRVGIRLSVKVSGAVISGMRGGSAALLTMGGANNKLTDALIGSGGKVTVTSGTAENILVNKGGTLDVQAAGIASLAWLPTAWSGTVTQSEGATVTQLDRDKSVYLGGATVGLIEKGDTLNDIAVTSGNSVLVYAGGAVNGATFSGAGANLYASGGIAKDLDVTNGAWVYLTDDGVLSDAVFSSNGYLRASGGAVSGATFISGGSMYYFNTAATCSDIVIGNGGKVTLGVGSAHINNLTILAGGFLTDEVYAGVNGITGTFTIDLNGAANLTTFYIKRRLTSIKAEKIVIADENAAAGDKYSIVSASDTANDLNFTLKIGDNSYSLANGGLTKVTDPFKNLVWSDVRTSSKTYLNVTDAAHVISAVDTAAALATNGAALNTSDREARWTSDTAATSAVNLASGMNGGNAWLELDGATLTKALYGTAENQNFAGVVNYKVNSGTTVKQLAAGAAKGGSVAGVNLTVAGGSFTNAFYAGGFGDVTNQVKVDIADGAFATNVFAGALCNYRATGTATTLGDIVLDIAGGEFTKCLYAGAAVMAGNNFDAAAPVHTVEDITVNLTGGTATGVDFCVYGGGYATGTNAATNTTAAYEAEDVEITVAGGTWGSAPRGGRGIFGGVYAAGVIASVEEVEITISAGTVQNVYGGGWAQQSGTSIVREGVEITIAGGSVGHVFGGGSYSSASGGSTSVEGDVSITISGGTINGNVYAGGQLENSTVAGDVTVKFAGDGTYTCGVYGYVTPPSATEGGAKVLDLTGFTGSIAGDIGGFDTIRFSAESAATLTAAAENVDNDEWSFDLAGTAGTSPLLTWEGGSFTGDTVEIDLAGATAPEAGWQIAAGLTGAATAFTVDTGDAVKSLALGERIWGGTYDGYGFSFDEGILKFSKLA